MAITKRRRTNLTNPSLLVTVCLYYGVHNHSTDAFSVKSPLTSRINSCSSLSMSTSPTSGGENNNINNDDEVVDLPDRRHLFQITATTPLFASVLSPAPAHAGSLIQFPVGRDTQVLKNRYHFMRAGLSELEDQHIYSTNPLFLTNRENELSSKGESMVLQALKTLKSLEDGFPTLVYHSLAANGMDTGDLIARELRLGREKLLPEFTYLDQRGVGLWDSGDENLVKPAVWALDYNEAGTLGKGGRPPAHEDGTPNETLGDQFVRLRQFISLQESRTSGDNILVIFPDGTGPALLSCMIAGVPYNQAHALEYAPGELRLDISPESVWAFYNERKDDPAYLATLQQGQMNLKELQEHPPVVALKEQKMQEERAELEAAFVEKQQAVKRKEREKQEALAQQKEMMRQKELQRKAEQEQKALQRKAEQEQRSATVVAPKKVDTTISSSDNNNNSNDFVSLIGTAALGMVGLGFTLLGTNGASSETDANPSAASTNDNDPNPGASSEEEEQSISTVVEVTNEEATASVNNDDDSVNIESKDLEPVNMSSASSSDEIVNKAEQTATKSLPLQSETKSELASQYSKNSNVVGEDEQIHDQVIRDQTGQTLAAGEQAMKDALENDSNNPGTEDIISGEEDDNDQAIQGQLDQLAAREEIMKDVFEDELFEENNQATKKTTTTATYIDDFPEDYADDWLQMISEIRDEGSIEEEISNT